MSPRDIAALNDPPEVKIVFVSPGGKTSTPMRFEEDGRLVEIRPET
jgi:hypothetical protein